MRWTDWATLLFLVMLSSAGALALGLSIQYVHTCLARRRLKRKWRHLTSEAPKTKPQPPCAPFTLLVLLGLGSASLAALSGCEELPDTPALRQVRTLLGAGHIDRVDLDDGISCFVYQHASVAVSGAISCIKMEPGKTK